MGINKSTGKVIIKIHKKYFRPNEVNKLIGNSKKSQNKLKWRPKITFDKLIDDMIKYEKKTNLYN